METSSFAEAAQLYWAAVGQTGPLPELPDHPVDALVDLIRHAGDADGAAFALFESPGDPYPAMAVGEEDEPWNVHWAIQLAEVEAFDTSSMPETTFLIDTIADRKGNHRVYSIVDLERGDLEFPSPTEALRWMTGRIWKSQDVIGEPELTALTKDCVKKHRDKWEKEPSSARVVFEGLLKAPLAEAWDAFSNGKWPVSEGAFPEPPEGGVEVPRWRSLWVVTEFLKSRRLALPEGHERDGLGGVHAALVDHLASFEEGLSAIEVPELVDQVAAGDDPLLAALGQAWVTRHEGWRNPAEAPEEAPAEPVEAEPLTPFARQLMGAIDLCLDALVRSEQIELDAGAKPALLAELTTAGADGRSVKHMLKKITKSLVNSEHVEEIYASDDEISDLLKRQLGG